MSSADIWEYAELEKRHAYFDDYVFFLVPADKKDTDTVKALRAGKVRTERVGITDTFLISPYEWLEGIDWKCLTGRMVFVTVAKGREAAGREIARMLAGVETKFACVWFEGTGECKEITNAIQHA